MKTRFLACQSTYDTIEIALFEDMLIKKHLTEDKKYACESFFRLMQDILIDETLSTDDLSFIAVNRGPGPFTTLRAIIASLNGLSFAVKIPLVGVNGLDAFLQEYIMSGYSTIVILLHAFAGDVYYAIHHNNIVTKECGPIDSVLQTIASLGSRDSILFLGNGASLHHTAIRKVLHERALLSDSMQRVPSIIQIAATGLQQWHEKKEITNQLFPLYFKEHSAVVRLGS